MGGRENDANAVLAKLINRCAYKLGMRIVMPCWTDFEQSWGADKRYAVHTLSYIQQIQQIIAVKVE